MISRMRLMGVVVLAVTGFAGSGTAWGQIAATCRGCNGDVPIIRVGVNDNLEVRVGWDQYVLIPGFGDTNPSTPDMPHYALDTLKFLVDFSVFQYSDGLAEASNVIVEILWLDDEQGGRKAKVTTITVERKAVTNKRIKARDMKKAIFFTRFGLDPSAAAINNSSLVSGATYTFHPTFTLMHTAGNRCSLPDPVNNLPAETDWPNGNEPSEWSPRQSGVVLLPGIPGYVGRSASYGPQQFTVTGNEDELVPLNPNLN